jgi:alginate O-acetyltransferase complex protein AlgI
LLFNSYLFIFLFLPITLIGFLVISRFCHHKMVLLWLVGASLFFYSWWNPFYLWLIIISILSNFTLGTGLNYLSGKKPIAKGLLVLGISFNLGLLGYFKYANFFINEWNLISETHLYLETIALPLAISFFTFQQITYLIDTYKGETCEYDFLRYSLFVVFFPQLIAGPIVHHKEMLTQFSRKRILRPNQEHLAVGITLFSIGLFKKTVLADSFIKYVNPVFAAAELGTAITFFEAWSGALAYSFQIYFDFSGYSDMALGLARMFGIRLPLNFNSPYKAVNIREFWSRWHMTLSRFFKDYIYLPLGGNRKGNIRQFINLVITMLLGGIWHGASRNFILWGSLHGCYLSLNHLWQVVCKKFDFNASKPSLLSLRVSQMLTFIAVVVGWVIFRAETIPGAMNLLYVMFGSNGITLPEDIKLGRFLSAFLIVWLAPNTQQIMIQFRPTITTNSENIKEWRGTWLQWKANKIWGIIIGCSFLYAVIHLTEVSEFLYFQF